MLERLDQALARSGFERAGRSKLVADPGRNFVVIMKDGKVYKNTLR